jgi:hypothetical protein
MEAQSHICTGVVLTGQVRQRPSPFLTEKICAFDIWLEQRR